MRVLSSTITKLGNRIELIGEESPENYVLIIGVFHGDEPQGKYLIEEYLKKNLGRGAKNNLLFIPCLNPDGFQNNTRTNANGVDLNRNFPTKNWGGVNDTADDFSGNIDDSTDEDTGAVGNNSSDYYGGPSPASEIETQFLIDTIEKYTPKLILTLHAPYKVVNYDGPADEVAKKISKIINYPVEASIGYPTPGSFGTYCGVERNIPTITLELDEKIPVEDLIQPVFEIFDMLLN